MVDTLVSGASAAMHAGSSPVLGTNLVRRFLAGAASIFFIGSCLPVLYSQSTMLTSNPIACSALVITPLFSK